MSFTLSLLSLRFLCKETDILSVHFVSRVVGLWDGGYRDIYLPFAPKIRSQNRMVRVCFPAVLGQVGVGRSLCVAVSSVPSVRLVASRWLNGNSGDATAVCSVSVTGVLAPFQPHHLYLSVGVRIQLFLSVSAFSIEFLSIVDSIKCAEEIKAWMTNPPGAMDRPFLCPCSEHCIRSHYPFIIRDLCPLGHGKIFSVLFWHIGHLLSRHMEQWDVW